MGDDKPNFVLVPDDGAEPDLPPPAPGGLFQRVRSIAQTAAASARAIAERGTRAAHGVEPDAKASGGRPRMVFGFDATASREPAWETARQVTDALVKALPGALDVALAVHGGGKLHTFTAFTSDARTLRDHAASVTCRAGGTRMLAILSECLSRENIRVVTYIGDVYEESPARGRALADALGASGIKLIVLHDTSDWRARRDAEIFADLAGRTGGCVLPFDASAVGRLREHLEAVAVFAVGGTALLHEKRDQLPGAPLLLERLGKGR